MTAESSDPVGTPAAGHVSKLIPASPHKDSRRRGRPGTKARGRKQEKKKADAEADKEQLPASADDKHSVDYLA